MHIIGHVEALSIRPAGAALPQGRAAVAAVDGAGLAGDIHADPLSPRQLLLASAAAYDDLQLPAHALRENLLVDFDTAPLVSGTVLHLGEEVAIRLMFQCEACGRLDLERQGLALQVGPRRGMLARVLRGGTIRRGDAVRDAGLLLPAWPEDWRARVARVVEALPPGAVLEYGRLAHLAGIAATYCRAMPGMLGKRGPAYAGKAISARTPDPRTRWLGQGLFDDEKGLVPQASQASPVRSS